MKYILTLYFGKYDVWLRLEDGRHALIKTVYGDKHNLVYNTKEIYSGATDACWYASESFMIKNFVAESEDPQELYDLVAIEVL